MLGAIVGDIVGSVYEFNKHRSKDFPLFRKDSHFTDDTSLTIATADALMSEACDFAAKYREYGRKYPSSYGMGFGRWIHDDDAGPYNSFGSGSVMRVSPVAWLVDDEQKVMKLAERSAEVTHNHPEGIKGAQAAVMFIQWARQGVPRKRIRHDLKNRFGYNTSSSVEELQEIYEYNETCQRTLPEAFRCFFEATDFEDAIRNEILIDGDSDTVAATAGSMAEAKWGVSAAIKQQAMAPMDPDLEDTYGRFQRCLG